jgi:hypothetical protein
MSYRDQVIARFGLRVVVPAVAVLVGALAIVIVSLGEMSDEVNRIEDRLTERSAEAALRVTSAGSRRRTALRPGTMPSAMSTARQRAFRGDLRNLHRRCGLLRYGDSP